MVGALLATKIYNISTMFNNEQLFLLKCSTDVCLPHFGGALSKAPAEMQRPGHIFHLCT